MRSITAGQQLPRQQQTLAGFPAPDFLPRQAVERHAARAGIGDPLHLGPGIQIRWDQHRRPRAVEREMNVPGGRTIGDHRDRQRRRMGGIVQHLDVEHRGQAAQPLRADAKRIDPVIDIQPQLLERRARPARNQVTDVDGIHQRFLGEQQGFLRTAADADAEHAGRTPTGTHFRHHLENPVGHRVGRVQHGEHRFVFRPAALGRHGDFHVLARDQFGVYHRRGVVPGITAFEGRIGNDRCA